MESSLKPSSRKNSASMELFQNVRGSLDTNTSDGSPAKHPSENATDTESDDLNDSDLLPVTILSQRSKSESKLYTEENKGMIGDELPLVSKRERLKAKKLSYKKEKKKATMEFMSTLRDPRVIILSDWLKIRGTLRSWTKLWCTLKPGLLLLYKTQKNGQWVGTVLLNSCTMMERPSKKDGFCFKLHNQMDKSIWALKGPKLETVGAITIPLPGSYLIFRASSEADGKCWMDAIELAQRCSTILMKSMTSNKFEGVELSTPGKIMDKQLEKDSNDNDEDIKDSDSESSERGNCDEEDDFIKETHYYETFESISELSEGCLEETLEEENKSLIWLLMKQIRPGMDLSKVVLPTFILEPRSFLDKLSDYHYHANFLTEIPKIDDPLTRMQRVVRWYLSGFYKKPKGLKKPYNPILGECFRCMWSHADNNSRTFYIAEQVSHHPPISAFYISNRRSGFVIQGSILAKSKFYGNSISAMFDGKARLTFLTRGEDYTITMPYAYCKGILYGTLTMELGGKATLECEKTGYRTELEFKLKPFLGSTTASNVVTGKIKLGRDTVSTISGHWDGDICLEDRRYGNHTKHIFWSPTAEMKKSRLHRNLVPFSEQYEFESEKLWKNVSEAINHGDQHAATEEKTKLEDAQRQSVRERKMCRKECLPKYFRKGQGGEWLYKYLDLRPWDDVIDMYQYEVDGMIKTQTKHSDVPLVRSSSSHTGESKLVSGDAMSSSEDDLFLVRNSHSRPKRDEHGVSMKEIKDIILSLSYQITEVSDLLEQRAWLSGRYVLVVVSVVVVQIFILLFKC